MKTTCSRVRQLEIAVSFYSPAKGSRAIHCLEKNTWSRIRGVGSGSQVIRRGAVVMPYKHLGKISDILHLNNENNQLER